jgi:hypothetical protein
MTDNGGAAFAKLVVGIPPYKRRGFEEYELTGGMTLRQWYKGMALAGYLPAPREHAIPPFLDPVVDAKYIARVCAELADALIAEDREAEKWQQTRRRSSRLR